MATSLLQTAQSASRSVQSLSPWTFNPWLDRIQLTQAKRSKISRIKANCTASGSQAQKKIAGEGNHGGHSFLDNAVQDLVYQALTHQGLTHQGLAHQGLAQSTLTQSKPAQSKQARMAPSLLPHASLLDSQVASAGATEDSRSFTSPRVRKIQVTGIYGAHVLGTKSQLEVANPDAISGPAFEPAHPSIPVSLTVSNPDSDSRSGKYNNENLAFQLNGALTPGSRTSNTQGHKQQKGATRPRNECQGAMPINTHQEHQNVHGVIDSISMQSSLFEAQAISILPETEPRHSSSFKLSGDPKRNRMIQHRMVRTTLTGFTGSRNPNLSENQPEGCVEYLNAQRILFSAVELPISKLSLKGNSNLEGHFMEVQKVELARTPRPKNKQPKKGRSIPSWTGSNAFLSEQNRPATFPTFEPHQLTSPQYIPCYLYWFR